MKKTYQVAGHRFALTMPDRLPVWGMMQNYEPFLTEDSDDRIFEVSYIDLMPDTSAKQVILKGTPKPGFPIFNLYTLDNGWMIEVTAPDTDHIQVILFCDKQFTSAHFHIVEDALFAVNSVLMMMFAFATAQKNTLLVHASVTMHQDRGYLFFGKSGTGKSTHSQLWIKNIEGCELLNDDNPALRIGDDGVVRVYGTPWSGKTPCYRNLVVPVGALVDLHQAKQNAIKRQTLFEAYTSLYVSYSGYRFIKEHADGFHDTTRAIVSRVPCYSLNCLPDADAAWLCHNTIVSE